MANLSLHYGLRQQIVSDLQALVTAGKLTGVPTTNILSMPVPAWRAAAAGKTPPLPAIIISPLKKYENPDEGMNEQDDTVYPVLIEFVMANGQDLTVSSDTFESWQEIVAKKYRHQYLNVADPVAEFFQADIEYLDPFDMEMWKNPGLWAGALILRPKIRQPRGV